MFVTMKKPKKNTEILQPTGYTVKAGQQKQVASVQKTIMGEHGEILQQEIEKHFTTTIQTDDFFMCFFKNFGAFYGLKHLGDVKLIACLCELAEFNTGIVQLSTKIRRVMSEKTGIHLTNLSRNLKRLKQAGLILEEEGQVTINPAVFWKGSTKERIEIIRNGGLTFKITIIEPNNDKG